MSAEAFLARELELYSTQAERSAYRAGLSAAAALCDAVKKDTETANTHRGRVTNVGIEMAHVAKRCGDRIWAFREAVPSKG